MSAVEKPRPIERARLRPTFIAIDGLDADLPAWIEEKRAIVARDGYALRPGNAPKGFTIEVKSLTPHDQLAARDPMRTNAWLPLGWQHGAICFATQHERDKVLEQLREGAHHA